MEAGWSTEGTVEGRLCTCYIIILIEQPIASRTWVGLVGLRYDGNILYKPSPSHSLRQTCLLGSPSQSLAQAVDVDS